MTGVPDPASAPPRPDLTFLRHRARPRRPAPPPPPIPVTQRRPTPDPPPPPIDLTPPSPPANTGSPLDLTPPSPPAGSGSPLDLTPPSPPASSGSPLDLGPPPAPAGTGSPLDLTPPSPPAGSGSSLDLGPPVAAPSSPSPSPLTRHRPPPVRDARRTAGAAVTRLTADQPTVTLTRVQSGAGALELALVRGTTAGDLSIGCVFQLDDGTEAVVQQLGDATTGPPGTVLPTVRWKGRPDGETLTFDLRRVTGLRRALVYGYSPSISVLSWNGVLVATTYGGTRIEIPIDHAPFSGTLALLTIYNVHGELVLRSEMDEHHGPPEMAAVAFDHHLPWIDGRTPVT